MNKGKGRKFMANIKTPFKVLLFFVSRNRSAHQRELTQMREQQQQQQQEKKKNNK